ncbi:MAG: hypothetical protein K2Y16_10885 [Burkholderiales bacterium]|nr:hypothetical protein [Burkholderiales bacterium]
MAAVAVCAIGRPARALSAFRSFIAAVTRSPEHMAIVSAVISLARALDLKVIAESNAMIRPIFS